MEETVEGRGSAAKEAGVDGRGDFGVGVAVVDPGLEQFQELLGRSWFMESPGQHFTEEAGSRVAVDGARIEVGGVTR